MPDRPRIRTAVPPDLPAVRELLIETWHDTYDAIYGRQTVDDICSRWHSLGTLSLQVNLSGVVFLVAEDEWRNLVGTALAGRSDRDETAVDLRRLYVRPSAQGRGVGKALLKELLASFPDAAAMRLEVEPKNAGAIRFYEREGFRRAGFVEHCSGDPGAWRADVMERVLRAQQ